MKTDISKPTLAAGIFGFLGVGLGAFGAHALRGVFSAAAQDWWHTAVLYHLLHAVALLFVAQQKPSPWSSWATLGFSGGIVLFSGSLYVLALTLQPAWGWITPFGGVLLLGGWFAVIMGAKRP